MDSVSLQRNTVIFFFSEKPGLWNPGRERSLAYLLRLSLFMVTEKRPNQLQTDSVKTSANMQLKIVP